MTPGVSATGAIEKATEVTATPRCDSLYGKLRTFPWASCRRLGLFVLVLWMRLIRSHRSLGWGCAHTGCAQEGKAQSRKVPPLCRAEGTGGAGAGAWKVPVPRWGVGTPRASSTFILTLCGGVLGTPQCVPDSARVSQGKTTPLRTAALERRDLWLRDGRRLPQRHTAGAESLQPGPPPAALERRHSVGRDAVPWQRPAQADHVAENEPQAVHRYG